MTNIWRNRFAFSVTGQKIRRLLVRRNYKDRLFVKLFHEKKALLELYNALNGTAYTDPEALTITTMEDVLYLGMKNDCSFILGSYLNLYEQQSTFCPNMPLRGFLYLADIYRAHITEHDFNLYGTRQIKLPAPRYVVFYNGTSDRADREELQLSDAFEASDACLSFTATLLNINKGHNKKLMEQCRTLEGYSIFIDKVRELQQSSSLEVSVDEACRYCIEHDVLREFLLKHRNEVTKVLLTEFDAKKQRKLDMRDAREEGLIEGRAEGRAEGRVEGQWEMRLNLIVKKIEKGQSLEAIAEALEESPEELRTLYEAVKEGGAEIDLERIMKNMR